MTAAARLPLLFGAVMMTTGAIFAVAGGWLAWLGGSPFYLVSGSAIVLTGRLFVRRRPCAMWLNGALFAATFAWAITESGWHFWPQLPRLVLPALATAVGFALAPWLDAGDAPADRRLPWILAGALTIALLAMAAEAFVPHDIVRVAAASDRAADGPPDSGATRKRPEEWRHYGHDPAGTRYSGAREIEPGNVQNLAIAWTYRTGDPGGPNAEDQTTPLMVDDTLYGCTPHDIVYALDADTGRQRWRFDPHAQSPVWQRCRGVGFYDAGPDDVGAADRSDPRRAVRSAAASASPPDTPAAASPPAASPPAVSPVAASPSAPCERGRIVISTIDARLIEVDATLGQPCPQFGVGGTVDLKQGMGPIRPGFYFQTSAPTVAGDLIIVGGWVWDNFETGEPSGAVRAFSARDGSLAWAWDLGDPAVTRLPPPGHTYTRGTPNMWSTPAFDLKLGLVYLPTGNATPDYFGAERTAASETYSSSVVALDIATGRERWHFQTVHHDLWDYDVPAQPTLADVPDGHGGRVPALIQVTKRGQIFMLDRRDGHPLAAVAERPVSQRGAVPEERLAPTQPYSIGMPAIGNEPLTEARMWGLTPFDQLYCRIQFRRLRYDGEFTPPGLSRSLEYPGFYGGMNWGSAAIDLSDDLLVVNDIRIPHVVQLIPRADSGWNGPATAHVGPSPQYGTPYAVDNGPFLSPLGLPCQQPPYGTLGAVDLKTRTLAWQVPLGTVEDLKRHHLRLGLALPIGMPSLGGSLVTATGLIFYAGTQDYHMRAFDVRDGRLLWQSRLPVGAQATPMTYVSPRSGRQYVVISAGGARMSPDRGDYVIAYRLP